MSTCMSSPTGSPLDRYRSNIDLNLMLAGNGYALRFVIKCQYIEPTQIRGWHHLNMFFVLVPPRKHVVGTHKMRIGEVF